MSAGAILAFGIVLIAAAAIGLVIARRAGGDPGADRPGHELDAPAGPRRGGMPARRQKAIVAGIAAALAAIGAALASALGSGHH